MHRHHLTENHWELNTLSCSGSAHVWISGVAIPSLEGSACAFASSHQAHTELLFHIYVGFPYLLMVNGRFTGDEAHGQCSARGEFHSCGHVRSKCSDSPQHLYMRPWDSSTNNCVFSRNYTWSFRTYTRGCPKRLLTYSKGPQNTPISAVAVAHLTVQTKKFSL